LVTRAEERHKLVTASLNFYKTAEQVCSVLDSLEREYKREDDWLSRHASGDHDRATLIAQLINKHQKGGFSKSVHPGAKNSRDISKILKQKFTILHTP